MILAREAREPPPYEGPVITSFLFQVRNVPAALYKALGGFATNGVNMIKLESYVDARFSQAQFYAEVLGHPEQEAVKNAFEELAFFSHEVERLGVYPADPFRFRDAEPRPARAQLRRSGWHAVLGEPTPLISLIALEAEQAGVAADRGGVDADRALGGEARRDSAARRPSGRCRTGPRRRTAAPRPPRRSCCD